jgi:hypothetical protein
VCRSEEVRGNDEGVLFALLWRGSARVSGLLGLRVSLARGEDYLTRNHGNAGGSS